MTDQSHFIAPLSPAEAPIPGPSVLDQPSSPVLPVPQRVTFNPTATSLGTPLRQQDDPFLDPGTYDVFSVNPSGTSLSPEAFNLQASETALGADVTPPDSPGHQTGLGDPFPPTPSRRQLRAEAKALRVAGNKKSRRATDTHTFFEEQDGKRACKFCL